MSPLRARTIRLAATQPPGSPLRRLLASAVFESQLDVGDPAWVVVQGQRLAGNVRAVTFTAGKVRYAVQVQMSEAPGDVTTFHNLDSVVVEPRPEGVKLDYFLDNYS